MTAIIVLLLLATWGGRTAFTDNFHKSQFKLELSSNGNPKNIPQLFDCSCELIVFPVYNSSFTATIFLINRSYTRAKILLKQSNMCRILTFNDKNQATMDVQNEVYDNQDEITQTIIIQLIGPDTSVSDDCEDIQKTGETRIVYIIRVRENKYRYQIKLPMNAEWLTQAVAIIVLLILPQNIKYRRRVPFQFGFVLTIVYSGFLFATVYVQVMLSNDLNLQITFWGIMFFSFACMVLYIADLFSIFIERIWIVWSLSTFFSLSIISVDAFILPDAWFINDIIAILVAAALIKFVVIKKLKAALLPILILWIFFIFRHFFVLFRLQNFQEALSINIIPLFLQLPAIISDDQKGYICSAFATSKIITMGLILNYCVRIDLFLSNHFYTIISTTIACVCLILQLGIAFLADDLPVTEYSSCILFIPITLICILLLASKRGEWAEVWHGSFHDISVDRKSIRKESSQLNDEEMYRNFDHLQLNPSLLSD